MFVWDNKMLDNFIFIVLACILVFGFVALLRNAEFGGDTRGERTRHRPGASAEAGHAATATAPPRAQPDPASQTGDESGVGDAPLPSVSSWVASESPASAKEKYAQMLQEQREAQVAASSDKT